MSWVSIGTAGAGMLMSQQQGQADRASAAEIASMQGGKESQSWLMNNVFGKGSFDTKTNNLQWEESDRDLGQKAAFDRMWNDTQWGGNAWERLATTQGQQAAGNLGADYAAVNSIGVDHGAANDYQRMLGGGQANANRAMMSAFGGADYASGMGRAAYEGGIGRAASANFDNFRDDRLSLLREQAAPQEERQGNALAQKLFSMGQLGSEGGARNMEAFGTAMSNADLQRQLSAQSMADEMLQRERGFGISMAGEGRDMMGFGADERSRALAANQAMMSIGGQGYNAAMDFNDRTYNRASERLGRTQDMFGFGSGVADRNLTRANQAIASHDNVTNRQRENASFMANLANATSGGTAGDGAGEDAAGAGFQESVMNAAKSGGATNLFEGTGYEWLDVDKTSLGSGSLMQGGVFGGAGDPINLLLGGKGSGFMDKVGGSISKIFSDIRLKDNLKEIGEMNGHKFYSWDWNELAEDVGADRMPSYGVIAQQVQEVMPEAVSTKLGYLQVDYDMVMGG